MSAGLVHVLQLASPALPVGGFSYSQGLEAAVDGGIVTTAESATAWIREILHEVMPAGELAVLARLLQALPDDGASFTRWHAWFRASRETRELRAESEQMGAAMLAWMRSVGVADAAVEARAAAVAPLTWPGAFALACHADGVERDDAMAAYAFSWLENQVLAAQKLVPLGQAAGQRMLRALGAQIPGAVARAVETSDDDVASFAPGHALASMRHETQYSRLFRS